MKPERSKLRQYKRYLALRQLLSKFCLTKYLNSRNCKFSSFNLGQKIVDKFTKLSKIDFSVKRSTIVAHGCQSKQGKNKNKRLKNKKKINKKNRSNMMHIEMKLKMHIGPLCQNDNLQPVSSKEFSDPSLKEDDLDCVFNVQLTSNFYQMSQRGGCFQHGQFWSHCLKYLLMISSNTSKMPQHTIKLKKNGGHGCLYTITC